MVARLTGLSPYVLRIWEQRYRAVEPQRTTTNRRLYSSEDVERLSLLREVTQAGYNIGQVATLPAEKLRELATAPRQVSARDHSTVKGGSASSTNGFFDACVAAVRALDARAFEETLSRAATALGGVGVLQRVVAPLADTIGELWRGGTLTAAHEHFASAALRVWLGNAARPYGAVDAAPLLLVATPAGQVHELGALLVGATAAHLGWQVTYLGASLPAAEIAGAAMQKQARAVALSLVYPDDDPRLPGELTRLREALPAAMTLLVGGRAAPAYHEVLDRIGAVIIKDLPQLGLTLDGLRKPSRREKR